MGVEVMRKLLLLGLLALPGCQGVVGPFQRSQLRDPVDDPRLTIPEQMRKGRDRLAYPDEPPSVEAPRSALDPPETYRYGR
jgi:hypothetical protein